MTAAQINIAAAYCWLLLCLGSVFILLRGRFYYVFLNTLHFWIFCIPLACHKWNKYAYWISAITCLLFFFPQFGHHLVGGWGHASSKTSAANDWFMAFWLTRDTHGCCVRHKVQGNVTLSREYSQLNWLGPPAINGCGIIRFQFTCDLLKTEQTLLFFLFVVVPQESEHIFYGLPIYDQIIVSCGQKFGHRGVSQ